MVQHEYRWPINGGEMGALIQNKNWSETPLGPVESWPQPLRTSVNLLVGNNFPTIICWGAELISIYNDAYQSLLGDKHHLLGESFYKIWDEDHQSIKPVIKKIFSGEACSVKNARFILDDNGLTEGHFNFSFNPIWDDTGTVVGFLSIAVEAENHKQKNMKASKLSGRSEKQDNELHTKDEYLPFILKSTNFGYWNLNLLSGKEDRSFQYDKCFGANEPFTDWSLEKFLSFVHPDDREEVEKKINNAITELEEWHFECRIIWEDNSIHWIDCNGNVFPTKDGEPARILSLVSDITERKQAREKVRESEKRLEIVLQTGKFGSWQLELGDEYELKTSDTCKINFGLHPNEELTYEQLQNMVHPEDRKKCTEKFTQAIKGQTDFETECRIIGPDGEIRWIFFRGHTLYQQDNTPFRMIGVTLNITERKQREEDLRKNETRLRLATQIANLGTWQYDPDSALVYLDKQMRTILGEPDSAARRPFSDVIDRIHPDDQISVKRAINDALDPSTSSTISIEYRIVRNDGTVCWISANGQAQFDENDSDKAVGFMGTARDVTARKRQEARLETMNETLEERIKKRTKSLLSYQDQLRSLASQLSKAEEQERRNLAAELHDNLGQLLTVCKMKISELKNDALPDHTATGINELTEFIDEAISYTRELMADLKPPPTIDEKDLYGIMNWVAKKMKKHGLNVHIENDKQPKPLDEEVRTTLLQAVRELLFNVVKHTYVKEAWLSLLRRDDYVQIIVEDKGKGFDPEEKKKAPSEDGGFGLFNIRERMDLLGGKLKIKSVPGQGTKAMLYVPIQKTDQNNISYKANGKTRDSSPAKSSVQTELWQTAKILIVDDHEMVRRGLRKMIENQDDLMVIAEASTGEEAVKFAQETSPDIIVMDVNLPGMDGIEATRKITADMPDVRIIGLSLHDEEGVAEDMRSAGASAYLTKTEAFETLCATIRSEATMAKG